MIYHERCAHFGRLRDMFNRRSNRNANISLALIAAALICFGIGLWRESLAWFGAAGVLTLGFVISFVHHGLVDRRHRRYSELWSINDEGLKRLRRDWAGLPAREVPPAPADHPYAADLDVIGHGSLYHLIGTPSSPAGQNTLREWMLFPAAPEVARDRQAAVAELAPLVEFRDELGLRGRLMGATQPNYEAFLRWAEGESWLLRRPWLVWLTRVLGLVVTLTLIPQLGTQVFYPAWLALAGVNLVLTLTVGRRIDVIIDQAAARQSVFQAYAEMFQHITTQSFAAGTLKQLQTDLSAAGISADRQMRLLGRMMPLSDIRRWMFFFPIQVITLWNFHVLWMLERRQRAAGPHARVWLTAMGRMEALAALSALAHDHPDWVFPKFMSGVRSQESGVRSQALDREARSQGDTEIGRHGDSEQSPISKPLTALRKSRQSPTTDHEQLTTDDGPSPISNLQQQTTDDEQFLISNPQSPTDCRLIAESLGHPLLAPEVCVRNDVELGPQGTFLLVTGSNMSGKSTLLRAIGLNVVLAQMGAPVCAARLLLPPMAPATSMRVTDSLSQGVSYFMAELRRLKMVVDTLRQAQDAGDRVPLFLLDEILQGTNTAERQIAARYIILHLIEQGALGAVSTHDLTLAESPEMQRAAVPVYFTETFTPGPEGPLMQFDYTLRPGIAPSTNALVLVHQVLGPGAGDFVFRTAAAQRTQRDV
jgi:hypothetical protein